VTEGHDHEHHPGHAASPAGSRHDCCADGNARAGSRVLGRLGPADDRHGHGHGAGPAVLRRAQVTGRVRAVLLFVGSYLAIWAVVGVVVYAAYRPHGSAAAGVLVIAAGLYELTPLKRRFRRECWENSGSGIGFGLCCVGSTIGLMVVMVALGVMSVTWISLVAVVAVAQKLWPPRAVIDVPVALVIVGLGLFILIAAPMI